MDVKGRSFVAVVAFVVAVVAVVAVVVPMRTSRMVIAVVRAVASFPRQSCRVRRRCWSVGSGLAEN